jgi:phosphohistidine phosphatase
MKLILVRHGEASDSSPSGLDRDRPLTDKGKADIDKIGNYLLRTNLHFHQIFHSPFLRTTQTANKLEEILNPKVSNESCKDLGCGEDCFQIFEELRKFTNSETIIIVGHNPDIGYLATKLLGENKLYSFLEFNPGSCIGINVAKETLDRGKLLWMVSPDFLN